ncbi:histidine kinase, partial [Nesterenkonia massiliensis]|uniref:histidine kinase n=1 Tax=Nesterenkonia massiliensis TaxID=1232429 RepID=UPI0011C73387
MTETQQFQQPPRALLTLLALLFVLWFMLGFVFSLVDPDYSLSGYYYLRFALVMMCLALLALGVVWALLGSLVATAATELLGFTSLEQTLFLLIMVGVAAAYSHRHVRTVYAGIVLAFCLYLAWLMEDPLTQLVLASTLAAVVAVAYLVGRAFRKMRLKQESSERELVEHQRQRARERRELAHELHDSIEHDLTIIGLQARSVSGGAAAVHAEELRRIEEHARSAGEHLRRVLELLTSEGAISESRRDGMDLLTGLEQFSQEIEAAGIPVTQEFSG